MEPRSDALPTEPAIQAAVSLLADPDRKIFDACRARLLAWGDLAVPLLERAVREGEPRLRSRARELLRTHEILTWTRAMTDFARAARRRRPRRVAQERSSTSLLGDGALLVSALLRGNALDRAAVADFVEQEGGLLQARIGGKSVGTAARLLAEQLAHGGRLRCEPASLYEEDHVHLDRVIESGQGCPAALGILHLLVARRAGLEATAVVLPEHFLVRVHGARPVLLDPGHEGRLVTKADCMRALRASRHGIHAVSYLEDVPDLRVLATLLRALVCVFGYREDREVCIAIESVRRALVGPEL